MKKKCLLFIMTITTMLVCIFGVSACGEQHAHAYTAEITKNATCIEKGLITYTCSCGGAYTQEILALGHDEKTHEAKAPTCIEIGWAEYVTCEREGCEYSTYQEISVTGVHTWDDGKITTEPTCTEKGVKTFTCTVCKTATYTEDVEALKHDEKTHEAKAPTCTEIGWEEYVTCEREGCEYSTYQEIPATGVHTWDDGKETKAPTCTEKGVKTFTCTVCKTATKTEPIDKLPHEYAEEWTSNATYHWHECVCGDKKGEEKHVEGAPATATTPQICTVCGYELQEKTGILFNTLTVDGTNVYGTVRNGITEFSFIDEVAVVGKAKFILSFDENGVPPIPTRKITLQEGNNVVYVFEMLDDELRNTYTVSIYRLHKYDVIFDVDGGTAVEKQTIEEGYLATEPTTTRTGYTFTGWDYDFTKPITENTTITAGWYANKDTEYTVNYYLQNLEDDEYTLYETKKNKGETDTTARAEIKEYPNFTYNESKSAIRGNIDGDGSQVLSVYYTRDSYKIATKRNNAKAGTVTAGGTYKFDKEIALTATTNAGYTFLGWYYGEKLVCKTEEFTFKAGKNITYTATWSVNTDTKYIVNYYLQNLDDDEYTLHESVELEGETDTTATAEIKDYTHFTYNASESTISGNIDGDGSQVLSVYYKRNSYTISATKSNDKAGVISGAGTYKYDKKITLTANTNAGYTWLGWYEGETCVCEDEVFTFKAEKSASYTATWSVNTDTKYTVIYYLQNIDNDNYTPHETVEGKGKTDTTATAAIKEYPHFTYNASKSVISGNINGDGGQILSVYYTRNAYVLSVNNTAYGTITNKGTHRYGKTITATAMPHLGYEFIGWYSGNELLSADLEYAFTMDKDVVAKFALKAEMSSFNFTSTTTTCEITGVKSKYATEIVVPDYVTNISQGAFSGCNSLKNITIPFVGESRKTATDIYQYPFGYIFGTSSYTGGTGISQYYYGSSTSSTTYTTYYIPTSLKTVTVKGGNILYGAFYNCSNLTCVNLPDGITSIGNNAFNYCTSLTSITLPDSITSIERNAFYKCSSLKSISIPDNVERIGEHAFALCSGLTSVSIPDGVISIGEKAFYSCSYLTRILVSEGNAAYQSIDGNLYSKDGKTLIQYAIGKIDTSFSFPNSVNAIGAYAFAYNRRLTSITIPNSIANIGKGAFYYCSGATSVVINDGVNTIGDNAFAYCTNVNSVSLGDSVNTIGDYAFEYCSKLTSITIPNNVTSIGKGAFNSCNGLSKVYVDGLAAWCNISFGDSYANPLRYAYTFYVNNQSIKDLVIPDGVTSIGDYAFEYFKNMNSITIPASVNSIGKNAFGSGMDTMLTGIYITDLAAWCNISFGDASANALWRAENLYLNNEIITELVIPESVTSIGNYAFSQFKNLTNVVIPSSVTSIGEKAFAYCDGLTSIDIPASVISIGKMAFYDCGNLTNITVDQNNTAYQSIDGNLYTKDGTRLIQCAAAKTATTFIIPDGVISIENGAFSECYHLTSVVMPDSVVYVGDNAFYWCNRLKSVEFSNSITTIGAYAFYNCGSLTSVVIPNSVVSIGEKAFYQCNRLIEVINKSTHITVEKGYSTNGYVGYYALAVYNSDSGITSSQLTNDNGYIIHIDGAEKVLVGYVGTETDLVLPSYITEIHKRAFYNCNTLTSVVIPDGITLIGESAFYGCSSLESITMSFDWNRKDGLGDKPVGYLFGGRSYTNNNSYIPTSLKEVKITSGAIGSYTFYNCGNLTNVIICEGVDSIGDYAFCNCGNLTSVIICEGVDSIGDNAFYGCNNLTSVVIPDSVITIGMKAFYNCSKLTNVEIGSGVDSIGNNAFYNCGNLASVTFKDTFSWYTTTVERYWKDKTGGTNTTVTDASTNAKYFRVTYYDYYWYKL